MSSRSSSPSRGPRQSRHVNPHGLFETTQHYIGDLVYGANDGILTSFAGVTGGALSGCVRQVVQFQIHGCGCDRLGGGPQFFLLFFQKLHIQVAMILEPALVGFGTEGSDQT